jgi:hypothetical protein
MRLTRVRFTVRRLMIAVAFLAVALGGSISAYRWGMREICLVEADYFRDRSARAASPMLRAENNEMVTFYERRWRSFGGGR